MISQSCDPRSGIRRSPLRLVGFIAYSRLVGNPVDLPCLAAVVGERLFEVRFVRHSVRPYESNKNSSAFPELLIVELASSILELSNHRLSQNGIFAVGPVDAPLMGLGIVEAESQSFDVAGWTVGFELFQVGAPVPDFASHGSAVEFDPGSR